MGGASDGRGEGGSGGDVTSANDMTGANAVNGMRVRMELSFRVANLERLARQFENRGVLLLVVEEEREGVPWRDFIAGLNVGV